MKGRKLEQYLKVNIPPVRDEAYWREFPPTVLRRIRAEDRCIPGRDSRSPDAVWQRLWGRFALVVGATAVVAVLLAPRLRHESRSNEQLQALRTYYHQVAELFPRQFEAVV